MPRKLLLIIPPCFVNRSLDFEIGIPVHLAMLGQSAVSVGWQVEYLDMALAEKNGFDSFARLDRRLKDRDINIVGISSHTVRTSVTTRVVADRIKRARSDVKVICGGVNATFMYDHLLRECSAIDYVLRGYAQQGLKSLLCCIDGEGLRTVPGLVSRQGKGFMINPPSAVDVADFKVPSLAGLSVKRYLRWTTAYPLLTHTGCGFSCNFCTSVMPAGGANQEAYRPVEDVVAEMQQTLGAGFNRFIMSANVFTSNREYCLRLCNEMRAAGLHERAGWNCMTRVECVDEQLLQVMAAAGCEDVGFGVETAGEEEWRVLGKGRFRRERIMAAFAQTRRAGIGTTAFLMLGTPTQTSAIVEDTLTLVRELYADDCVVNFFQPFPGTHYWAHREELGLSDIAPYDAWNFFEAPICRTRHLDKRELMRMAIRAHLECAVRSIIDPRVDSLQWRDDLVDDINTLPLPPEVRRRALDRSVSIDEMLSRIIAEDGARAGLMFLRWAARGLREGVLRVYRDESNA